MGTDPLEPRLSRGNEHFPAVYPFCSFGLVRLTFSHPLVAFVFVICPLYIWSFDVVLRMRSPLMYRWSYTVLVLENSVSRC